MAGLYLQVEVLELDDDRLIEAGMEGRGVYGVVGLLAKRTETDGWVTMAQLRKEGATAEQVDRLHDLGLLDRDVDGRVRQDGWLDRNPSQAAIDMRRQSKADAGKRGNHDRWKHPEPFDSCSKCHVVAVSDPTGVAPPNRVGSPDTESESDTKSEAAIPPDDSENRSDSATPAVRVAVDEQAVNRALLRYSRIVTDRTPNVTNPDGFAASVRRDAQAEGITDDLRALIASGLTPDEAARERAGGEGMAAAASVPAAESVHPLLRAVPDSCGECSEGWVLPVGAKTAQRCPNCNPALASHAGGMG